MIVAFEGIDFSGKTTQITLLSSEIKAKTLSFPRKENKMIWDYLYGKESFRKEASFFMFLADIIDGIYKEEAPLLICDRYVYSTIAYSKVVSFENAKKIVQLSPAKKPSIVFYLDLSIEEYKKRTEKEFLDTYEKDISFIKEVKRRYDEMYKEKFFAEQWVRIDASLGVEKIHEKIRNHLKDYLNL